MSHMFQVDDVTPDASDERDYEFKTMTWSEKLRVQYTQKTRTGMGVKFAAPVEAAAGLTVLQHSRESALLATVALAYNRHRPLSLSPDHIWLAISHGFAQHVKSNAEALRSQFVAFEGKKFLEIRADDFVKGSPANDWPRMFKNFSEQIAEHVGKKRDLLTCDFSTTGPVEKACSEIVLMDAMSKYFDYGMSTLCGFPQITLEGTAEDWASILVRVNNLREFGDVGWWLDPLAMVCGQLVRTATGKPDLTFWRSMYMASGGSGGPRISGWINAFYPYVTTKLVKNSVLGDEPFRAMLATMASYAEAKPGKSNAAGGIIVPRGGGPHLGYNPSDYPSQMSAVPVKWQYHATEYEMRFLGGLAGTTVDALGGVRPAVAWGVLDVTALNDDQRTALHL